MLKLYIIESLCDGCEKCNVILPHFYHQQPIYISKKKVNADEMREAAQRAVDCCPNCAVRLEEFTV